MKLLPTEYRRPFYLPSAHLETIIPIYLRPQGRSGEAKMIELPDGDFLEADFYQGKGEKLLIISHGLEGSSGSPYVLGMVAAAQAQGWDVVAWNHRSCGGRLNRLPRLYHSGESHDLASVVSHFIKGYHSVFLAGFSVGGNITLKYLAENANQLSPTIKGAVSFSAPLELRDCALLLERQKPAIYLHHFLKKLKARIMAKAAQFPEVFDTKHLNEIDSFRSFDDCFTAPLHGFQDALDYWQKCSSLYLLEKIKVPTLLLQALNDPFLPESAYPILEHEQKENMANGPYPLIKNPHLSSYYTKQGGHCGFILPGEKSSWAEQQGIVFLSALG
jgi:predicted alpha/beta-fold hydrolase